MKSSMLDLLSEQATLTNPRTGQLWKNICTQCDLGISTLATLAAGKLPGQEDRMRRLLAERVKRITDQAVHGHLHDAGGAAHPVLRPRRHLQRRGRPAVRAVLRRPGVGQARTPARQHGARPSMVSLRDPTRKRPAMSDTTPDAASRLAKGPRPSDFIAGGDPGAAAGGGREAVRPAAAVHLRHHLAAGLGLRPARRRGVRRGRLRRLLEGAPGRPHPVTLLPARHPPRAGLPGSARRGRGVGTGAGGPALAGR